MLLGDTQDQGLRIESTVRRMKHRCLVHVLSFETSLSVPSLLVIRAYKSSCGWKQQPLQILLTRFGIA